MITSVTRPTLRPLVTQGLALVLHFQSLELLKSRAFRILFTGRLTTAVYRFSDAGSGRRSPVAGFTTICLLYLTLFLISQRKRADGDPPV